MSKFTEKDIEGLIQHSYREFKDKDLFYEKIDGKFVAKTYGEFISEVWALAEILLKHGYKGKKVLLLGKNSSAWMAIYLAVFAYVGIIVPIDKEWTEHDLKNVFKQLDIDLLFHDEEYGKLFDALGIKTPRYVIGKDTLDLLEQGSKLAEKPEAEYKKIVKDIKDICTILFSSGTTAASKMIALSPFNLMASGIELGEIVNLTSKDRYFMLFPLHHVYTSIMIFLLPLYEGISIYIAESPKDLAEDLQVAKPTYFHGVPIIYERILAGIPADKMRKIKLAIKVSNFLRLFGLDLRRKIFKDFHKFFGGEVRRFFSGAASLNPVTAKFYKDMGIDIIRGYGLTESSSIVSVNPFDDLRLDSEGKILKCIQYKFKNVDDKGVGELWIKGNNVITEYYNNPELSKERIDAEKFLDTGDLGYVDKEGFLYITGRCRRSIVTENGRKIQPEEIESLFLEAANVRKALVYNEANTLKLKLRLNKEITDEEVSQLVSIVNNKLPGYKRIDSYDVVFEKDNIVK